MILRLALRNLLRHRLQSLLLLLVLTISAALFVLGNSVLVRSGRTLRALFTGNVTGELVIKTVTDESIGVFGLNTQSIEQLVNVPVIKQQGDIEIVLAGVPGIAAWTPLVVGNAVVDINGNRTEAPIFGVEPDGYFGMFAGLEVVDGRLLEAGARESMITRERANQITASTGSPPRIGDEILLTTLYGQSYRIRAAELVGIYRYPVTLSTLSPTVIVDALTLRELNEVFIPTARQGDSVIEDLPTADSVDSLFGDTATIGSASDAPPVEDQGALSLDEVLERATHSASNSAQTQDAAGASNFILIRVAAGNSIDRVRTELTSLLEPYDVEVIGWREAAGNSALLSALVQLIFNGGFAIFAISVVIACANVLLISTYRRTREIGTIRALGGQRTYVRRLLYSEIGVLALMSAALGTGVAWAAATILDHASIHVGNELLATLVGGNTLRLRLDGVVIIVTIPMLALITFVATEYPVRRILRTSIVRAVQKG